MTMMTCTCTKEQLDRALRYSAKALARHSTLPIIQNILLQATGDALTCTATNLDVGVRVALRGKVAAPGSAVVPPQLLASFIAAVPAGETVTLTAQEDHSVVVESASSRAVIKGFDPADFPPIPERDTAAPAVEVTIAAFRDMLARVSVSVAKTEARPELTGVNMVFAPEELRIAATDGFRLSEGVLSLQAEGIKEAQSVIVPASAVAEVLYITGESEETTMTVRIADGQIFFDVDGTSIVSRLISGTYPDYRQIIPQQHTTQFVVAREVCERVLRLADAFASQTTSDMALHVVPAEGRATVRAVSQERGENESVMEVHAEGDEQTIYLNTRYVLDGVTRCGTDAVRIALAGAASPVVITPEGTRGEAQFLYLVMPIRK